MTAVETTRSAMVLHLQAGQVTPSKLLRVAVLVWVTLLLAAEVRAADFYLEAAASEGSPRKLYRSNARTGISVRLEEGEYISLTFCLRETTRMQVMKVLYSNDGPMETMAVVVDGGSTLGTFSSHNRSELGRLWNEFLPSPTFPRTLHLSSGRHSLRVEVDPRSDGVELDSVHVWFSDEGLTRGILDCSLTCLSSLPTVPPNTASLWQKASAKQASYPTRCAEEDNVKVPLYLGGVSEYTVTATMPTYVSSANHREANDTGCVHLSPILFTFTNLPVLGRDRPLFETSVPGASLLGRFSPDARKLALQIEFPLKGRSQGHVDADMGSILRINFKESTAEDVVVRTAYLGRSGRLTALENSVVPAGSTQHEQHFPDFTWQEEEEGPNVLQLEFQSATGYVGVTGITLIRRAMRGERVRTVYHTDSLVVEALEVDFWWRRPEVMTLVNGETDEHWAPTDYFRIYLRVPGSGHYAQVLVMYQDGNVRLAPLPPPGVDWIPFGSSVIIGYSDPAHLRPSAPIQSVTFYPSTLALRVNYQDGGSVNLKLSGTQTHTQLTVQDIAVGSSREAWRMPFATLRSMYIDDSNSDCDSVLVDGQSYRSIMGQWGTLEGKSFFFFRRCESRHLTWSPDIRIDVRKTSVVEEEDVGEQEDSRYEK